MKIYYDSAVIAQVGGAASISRAVEIARDMLGVDCDPTLVDRVPETPSESRFLIREGIAASAGDTLSLLGTASDGAQLLLYHMAKMTQGLASANSLAEVREATVDFAPLADALLAKVSSGDVKLPFLVKGEAEVMAEIENRATAVSEALTQ